MDRLAGGRLGDGQADLGDGVILPEVDLDPLERKAPRVPARLRIAVDGEGTSLVPEDAVDAGGLLVSQVGARSLSRNAERGAVLEIGSKEAGEGVGLAIRQRRVRLVVPRLKQDVLP